MTLVLLALIIALVLAIVSLFVPGRRLLAASVILTLLTLIVDRVPK